MYLSNSKTGAVLGETALLLHGHPSYFVLASRRSCDNYCITADGVTKGAGS